VNTNDGTTGTPAALGYRMPAEWEARDFTLMAWPVRPEAWLAGLEEARDGYAETAHAIAEFEKVVMIARPEVAADARARLSAAVEVWELDHDDSWVRDSGPTFLLDDAGGRAAVNWRFNAWGRKYSPYDADDRLAAEILSRMGVPRFDAPLVLEGGSIHSDGEGTILTTEECLLNPNRNPELSRSDIEGLLRDFLGVRAFVWLGKGLAGDETDGHVDNLACFVRPGTVLVQGPLSAENAAALERGRDAAGRRLSVMAVDAPPPRSCAGEALTLSYVNYYPTAGGIVVPLFGRDDGADMKRADDRALGVLREAYPDRKIVPVDGMKIIKGGGNVHCITQQVPAPRGRKL